jgi:hypothetical protein
MEPIEGEPRRSTGQDCPALLKLQKANAEKLKSETLKLLAEGHQLPDGHQPPHPDPLHSQDAPHPACGHLLPIRCGEGKSDLRGASPQSGEGEVVRLFQVLLEKLAEIERTLSAHISKNPTGSGLMSLVAKMAGLAIIAACVTGELSPEPNVGQSIHAHGGHENKRLVVRRPVVRKKSDGADPKPSPLVAEKSEKGGTSNIEQPTSNIESGELKPECVARAECCVNRLPDGLCRTTNQPCRLFVGCEPHGPSGLDDIRAMLSEIRAEVVGRPMWPPVAAPRAIEKAETLKSEVGPKPVKKSKTPDVPVRGSVGRLRWDNDFREIRLGGVLHNLETRKRARFCIKHLAAWKAYDEFSARHLEKQIEPYVRAQAGMDPLPESSKYNLRIQQYFLGNKNHQKLCSELIKSAGNGRYYLRTQ